MSFTGTAFEADWQKWSWDRSVRPPTLHQELFLRHRQHGECWVSGTQITSTSMKVDTHLPMMGSGLFVLVPKTEGYCNLSRAIELSKLKLSILFYYFIFVYWLLLFLLDKFVFIFYVSRRTQAQNSRWERTSRCGKLGAIYHFYLYLSINLWCLTCSLEQPKLPINWVDRTSIVLGECAPSVGKGGISSYQW